MITPHLSYSVAPWAQHLQVVGGDSSEAGVLPTERCVGHRSHNDSGTHIRDISMCCDGYRSADAVLQCSRKMCISEIQRMVKSNLLSRVRLAYRTYFRLYDYYYSTDRALLGSPV